MHRIIRVAPKPGFVLQLTFDRGEIRLFDLRPYLRGALFLPLRDEELFRKVQVSDKIRGLSWPNGADLCADMLYMESTPERQALQPDVPVTSDGVQAGECAG
jgi:hypothetical protein